MVEHYLDRLASAINENWDQPALTDFYLTDDGTAQDTSRGSHYTYGEMYAEILHLGELFQTFGLQKGDHIAICGANSSHWAIAYLAIAAYQGVVVTVLHAQSTEDIAHQIDFSDAKALFTDADLWEELKDQSLPQVENVITLENWQILRGKEIQSSIFNLQSSSREACFNHGEPDSIAMISFTSGSTGIAKGVTFSERGVSSNVSCAARIFPSINNKRTLVLMPMDHFVSLVTLIGALITRCELFIMRTEITAKTFMGAVLITRPYILPAVPKLASIFLSKEYEQLCQIIYSSLEYLVVTGAILPTNIAEQLQQRGLPLTMGYGMTECPIISAVYPQYYKINTSGKVCDELISTITSTGEILVKGTNIMLGYYKAKEATARKIDADGWLHTGDKGHLDEDGYLYVEGRLEQDMIVLPNGENIHPEDIERKINALPEVSESIVLARDGKLVAIVVSAISNQSSVISNNELRRAILRAINPQLPLYSQLYDVEITDTPLQKTEKQTIKRYLYK